MSFDVVECRVAVVFVLSRRVDLHHVVITILGSILFDHAPTLLILANPSIDPPNVTVNHKLFNVKQSSPIVNDS